MKLTVKVLTPLITVFLVLLVLIFSASFLSKDYGINYNVVHVANIFFFCISVFVFSMQYRALGHENPNVFIRSVMSGTMIKVFACLIAVAVYYFTGRESFNKPAVILSMVVYVIYLVVEVRSIMKLNKSKHA